jgi:MerR HTH family regulatory protein
MPRNRISKKVETMTPAQRNAAVGAFILWASQAVEEPASSVTILTEAHRLPLACALEELLAARFEPADHDLITGGQAARLAGVSRATIKAWRDSGKLAVAEKGKGERSADRYRAGDVRDAAKMRGE